ncbi:hypothetical protein [Xenorhabdus sp. SGI246]
MVENNKIEGAAVINENNLLSLIVRKIPLIRLWPMRKQIPALKNIDECK